MDEDEKVLKDLLGKVKSQTEEMISKKGFLTKEDQKEIEDKMKALEGIDIEGVKSLLNSDKGIMSIVQKQGAEITALKEAGNGKPEDLSIRGQVAAWQTKNKDVIARIKAGQKIDIPDFELKENSPMTPSNTYNSSAYLPKPQFEAGLHDLRRVSPTFWDYIPKGRTSQAAYVWVNKIDASGSAAFIGAGVSKPGISFELETEVSNAKKIAVSLKTAIELLDDIEGMTSFIEGELAYALKAKLNTTLMTGTLSSTVPAGISTVSVAYTLTGVETANPNNFDAIRAVVAQIRLGFFYGPITVFVNPVDAANMDLTKASDSGVYMLPPFSTANGQQVAGAVIVEDANIPAGYFQAAVLDLFKVLIYKDFRIAWGWENEDFTKNLVTVIGEMRVHSFHSDNDAGAFVYDTFANVISAIDAA